MQPFAALALGRVLLGCVARCSLVSFSLSPFHRPFSRPWRPTRLAWWGRASQRPALPPRPSGRCRHRTRLFCSTARAQPAAAAAARGALRGSRRRWRRWFRARSARRKAAPASWPAFHPQTRLKALPLLTATCRTACHVTPHTSARIIYILAAAPIIAFFVLWYQTTRHPHHTPLPCPRRAIGRRTYWRACRRPRTAPRCSTPWAPSSAPVSLPRTQLPHRVWPPDRS